MFRIINQDTIKVWEAPLSNWTAPTTAVVTNGGSYLVTLDNWASLGYGDNVFVVYSQQGHLLKQYALADFSPFPIDAYRRSISSLWWCCGIKPTTSQQIQLCFYDEEKNQKTGRYNLSTLQFEF
ncbi:hypothetical protein J0X19_02190 [Hymenobacter sp. BT186]|uniref:Uncharacterized protein n=1 Tax=Hymenobacter telluris TaxID=2816474 RepID=A0A939ESK4_9BACT|nr:hypothetical protein [Hymenobacter telluris]MBO0356745.1 hypothetical protein [Hymenobacter telluris]MBW3372771.1 hypothetical protein [Hymenobacter norwichensis]